MPVEPWSARQAPALSPQILEAIPSAVVLVDAGGHIVVANSRAARLFGYAQGELDGQPLEQLMPARYRDGHRRYHADFMREPGTREMGAGRELFGLRKDGSEISIEVGLDVLRAPPGTFVLASINDVSDRRRARREAEEASALAQSIIDGAPFSILATDLQGVILEVSPAAERLIGIDKPALLGQRLGEWIHDSPNPSARFIDPSMRFPQPSPSACAPLLERLSGGGTDAREWMLHAADGRQVPIHLAISGLRRRNGELAGYIGIAQDISERRRDEERMRYLAEHDVLTGLANRAGLHGRLDYFLAQARRKGSRVGVLLLDLDHFKRVNDSLGHVAGDQLLLTVARRLKSALRECDTVARMGGDEFVVLLPDLRRREDASEVAAKVVEALSPPMTVNGHLLQVSASIGVCVYPEDGADTDLLLLNADSAMYAAKETGRRRFLPFTPAMAAARDERWRLEHSLREALNGRGFRIAYQPQVRLDTGEVVGAEALLRWPQDNLAHLMPGQFIPVAEQTGLIGPIGEWVLRTACAEFAALRDDLPPGFRLAINLSPRQLRQSGLAELVAEVLHDIGLAPETLELEITESALLQDDISTTVTQLRSLGIHIAIDDFGTGYSSLSHITRFPIDCLKIDRSFVAGTGVNSSQSAVSAAIVAMGTRLGVRVVAEGIETPEQLAVLHGLGCPIGQGFLFSPAVPVKELAAVVRGITGRFRKP